MAKGKQKYVGKKIPLVAVYPLIMWVELIRSRLD